MAAPDAPQVEPASAPTWRHALLGAHPVLRILLAARLVWPLGLLLVLVLAAIGLALARPAASVWLLPTLLGLTLALLLLLVQRLRSQLLKPLTTLEESVAQRKFQMLLSASFAAAALLLAAPQDQPASPCRSIR